MTTPINPIAAAHATGVSVERISKSYGATRVLNDVSLSVARGEFLTLLGPSGCGKSTLLKIIAGLDAQDDGAVAIGGRRVDGLAAKDRDIAMVFQTYALYPHMTVAQNIALPLRMRRLTMPQRLPIVGRRLPGTRAANEGIDTDVRRIATALGLEGLLDRKPAQLSGGQRQRVAVGRAMVRNPAVFLMDEPLSNLDAKLRVQMRSEIKDLHRRLGVTFIYVTHDQAEAMTMSDRVAVMLEGSLLQVSTPQEIYADPQDRRVAELIGSPGVNIIEVTVRERGVVEAAGRRLAIVTDEAPGTRISLGIRPEVFQLVDRPEAGPISGHIHAVEHLGSDVFVHVQTQDQARPLVVRLAAEHASQAVAGRPVHLGFETARVFLFTRDGRRVRPHASVTPLRSFAS